jgi:imidazolonepropionase-like amidohydrolase
MLSLPAKAQEPAPQPYPSAPSLTSIASDAGVGPNKPHDVLPHGVVGLPRIGMTNAQALTATTAVAAEVCGIADTTGTLEPGKDADFVAVRGNPLEDINAIYDVAAVFVQGTQVPMPK